ncbi:Metallo-beta-lactamase superfamily [Gaiella occulta]|uniref:Metallo-beta-lactamase superfamily n=1 Tax=Gaiella occulta TaxID=1002870 RepID=A0A7M2YTI6_9ACTN|nr:MBL fold metallo-hydrolase [Gaiella occulta]RDI73403.1 Metallo-beta-lactamase superfamily [Gaiella occulta]
MRVCIHRGAAEIGGNVVEVEHERARVVLDLGLPLAAALDGESLPRTIGGLLKPDNSLLGVVITHGHPDHYGLIGQVDPEIPVYVGAATARILAEAAFFTPMGARIQPTGLLADRTPFELGPFKITPFLVDHSAFDAYALLVEAGGRRLFYSGDLRGHGRKHGLFERLITNPPPPPT